MSDSNRGTHPNAPLTSKETASLIGTSTRTLERWRKAGAGPSYAVHRGRIWYRRSDIDAYLDSVFAPRGMHPAGSAGSTTDIPTHKHAYIDIPAHIKT